MANGRVGRSQRKLNAEEKSRLRSVRRQVETERENIIRRGRQVFADHERALAQAMGELKRERLSQGISLQDVAQRMGTDRSNVHRLERGAGNPTWATLARYAEALGKRIVITVASSE